MTTIDFFVNPILEYLPKLPSALISLIVGIVIVKVIYFILVRALKIAKVPAGLRGILSSLGLIILWVLLTIAITKQLGLNNISLTLSGSLVVVGLALANGATALTSDVLSGIFLSKDPDFKCGYIVKIGDVEGEVEKMDFRKTRLRTKDGKRVVVPNSTIEKGIWQVIDRNNQ